jgi:hypothetical protein
MIPVLVDRVINSSDITALLNGTHPRFNQSVSAQQEAIADGGGADIGQVMRRHNYGTR